MNPPMAQVDLPPGAQSLARWRQIVDCVFDGLILETRPESDKFFAAMSIGQNRLIRTACIRAAGQTVRRAPDTRRTTLRDDFAVMVQMRGEAILSQAGLVSLLQPGDVALFDNGRPYTLEMTGDFEQHLILIDRERYGGGLTTVEQHCGRRLDRTASTRVLRAVVSSIAQEFQASGDALIGLSQSAIDLIVSGLLAQSPEPGRKRLTDSLYRRLVADARHRLYDPELSPAQLAAAHGILVRYLHRLFSERGFTMMAYVREARLNECARQLSTAGKDVTLGRLSQRFGFDDEATFRRAFKRQFGVTPSQYAKQHGSRPREKNSQASKPAFAPTKRSKNVQYD